MNVLFITADQWRGECLSALGHPQLKTPNLDRLAADGVIFKNHYAQGGALWTISREPVHRDVHA